MSKTALIKYVIIRTLPILTGYVVLGIGFGILLEKAGYNILWAVVMAITIFSGTIQYVGIDLLTSGASLITAAIVTLMVNARYIFYGVATVDRYKTAGLKKYYMIFGLTDESYALICANRFPRGVNRHTYDFLVTLFDHLYWIIGCCLGALIGSKLTIDTTGVEFVMTALFTTIFVDQWRETKEHIPAITGVSVTVLCLIIFGPDNFLIPAMIIITTILTITRSIITRHGWIKTMEDEK